jgi:hypothetical protein
VNSSLEHQGVVGATNSNMEEYNLEQRTRTKPSTIVRYFGYLQNNNHYNMLKAYRNSAIFAILLVAGIQWGFYKNYTSEFPNFIDKTTTIHIHGALLMTCVRAAHYPVLVPYRQGILLEIHWKISRA